MIPGAVRYINQFPKSLWILSIGWFVSALGFSISIPFISIYFHASLGLSIAEIGLFFGVMALVRSVFQIIGGEVSDRIDRRNLLIHAQVIRAATFFLLALAIHRSWGFVAMAICLLVNSIFGALFQPAANATVSDILPRKVRLDGFAVIRTAINLGWAAGPALGGFLAGSSYGLLFLFSGAITLVSGMVVLFFLRIPKTIPRQEHFRFSDILAVRKDLNLALHCGLIFILYLVHSQLIAPFSVYAVEMVRIPEYELGLLYTLNGLMVVLFQIPVTRLLARRRLTAQLALGSLFYAIGYGIVGFCGRLEQFVGAVVVITIAEIVMSPPSLALTSRLAPAGRAGRYMGIFGFFVASGWSLGPLYGGLILDRFGNHAPLAWIMISSLAIVSGIGYIIYGRRLPGRYNLPEAADSTS